MRNTKGKRFADKKSAKSKNIQNEKRTNISILNVPDSNNINKFENNNVNRFENNNVNRFEAEQYTHSKKDKKKKKKKKSILFNIIIIICLAAIIYSSYNIVLWFIDNYKNKKLLEDLYNDVTITEEDVIINDTKLKKKHYDITKLIERNPDTVGWIYVNNTNIDYPIVQAKDNDFYLNHTFDKESNSVGSIFADYRCSFPKLGYNTVVYGHNRKDGSMFGTLQRSLTEEWYSEEENLYINMSTANEDHIYRVFSTFVCNDEDVTGYTQTSFSSKEDFKNYVNKLKQRSSHNFETDLNEASQILTLYTCYGINNQRLLVCAVLVE